MPYFVHAKDTPADYNPSSVIFSDRATAYTYAKEHSLIVTFAVGEVERDDWHYRELERFRTGVYQHVPWSDMARSEYHCHFAHLSIKQPGLVAYTVDDEKGIADRQTAIKPGRYLEQFYPDMPKSERDRYCGMCSAQFQTLQITNDPNEIEAIYTAEDSPDSCMCHPARSFNGHCHPVRVYGGKYSDLALAWCGDLSQGIVKARAIVWPAKKRYSRIYGHESLLHALLTADGWSNGSLKGAKIAAISDKNGNGWIMPYVDNIACAQLTRDNQSFVLGEGNMCTAETIGVSGAESDEDYFTCESCNDHYPEEENNGANLCQTCDEHQTSCDGCESYFDDRHEHFTSTRDENLCEACAREATVSCALESCDETWIEAAEFSHDESRQRESRHVDRLCRSCADAYDHCADCDNYTTRGSLACDECTSTNIDRSLCERTIGLLLDPPEQPEQPTTYQLQVLDAAGFYPDWSPCYQSGGNVAISADYDEISDLFYHLRDRHPRASYRIIETRGDMRVYLRCASIHATNEERSSCEQSL